MPWYETWFDRDEYEQVYQDRDADEAEHVVDLIEAIAEPVSGARILDVGCGRGRHAISLARRGYDVTGLDLSPRALERARRRAEDEALDVAFVRGDMREAVCDGCFDGVVNLFTAFGYFDEEADHQKAVDAMACALRPGGWLVQDFLNQAMVRRGIVPRSMHEESGLAIEQRRWIADGRVNKEIILHDDGRTHTFHESVALLGRKDFERLYARAGLVLDAVMGDYDGTPYTADSPRLILLAHREG